MTYPAFFETTASITLKDPLSEILGAFDEGLITYTYLDVVKTAGHSCPTVAGAYLMVREGLKALYGSDVPLRGGIKVYFKEAQTEGVTGVVGNVFSLITGATDVWGFKGLSGQFARHHLMEFNASVPMSVRMERIDTNVSVDIAYTPSILSSDEALQPLMKKLMLQLMTAEEKILFRSLWQAHVEKILENFDKVIVIKSS